MSKETFSEAVAFFLDTASRIPCDAWTNEALGVWNVRDLVGHTSRAILLVEEYSTEGTTRSGFGTPDEIAERGRQAGRALGDDPVDALRTLAERVLTLVERLPDDHPDAHAGWCASALALPLHPCCGIDDTYHRRRQRAGDGR